VKGISRPFAGNAGIRCEKKNESSAQIIGLVCFVAIATPFLFGYGTLPLTNFVGEIVSAVGFGMMLVLATHYGGGRQKSYELKLVHSAFGLLGLMVAVQYLYFGQGHSLVWLLLFLYLLLACVAAWAGFAAHNNSHETQWLRGMAFAVVGGGCIASVAAVMQYFSVDGSWVLLSPTAQAGRTFGFVRQPNHQGTFLCLGVVAIFTLQRLLAPRIGMALLILLSPLLVFGIVSTGSRTALLELGFISLFTIYHLRGQKSGIYKALYPVTWAALLWLILYYVSQQGGAGFYGTTKLAQTTTEGVGVRAAVWAQTWDLVVAHPWLGSGLPYYSSLFYISGGAANSGIIMTHSHNLFLQFAYGFGIPVTVVFFFLVARLLWRARHLLTTADGFFSFAIIGCVLIHSQVEFPLWYTYFLLPVCWCLGWLSHTLGSSLQPMVHVQNMPPSKITSVVWSRRLALGVGALVLGTSAWMNTDYYRVTPIFTPGLMADLNQRIHEARRSDWFQRYVEYVELNQEQVTLANYGDHLARAVSLGCAVPESWYQPNTIIALTFAGRLDEARWILYSYMRLAKGKVDHLKAAFLKSNPPHTAEMLQYLETQKAVPKSTQLFEEVCFKRKSI
jgi:O-antigen ligase